MPHDMKGISIVEENRGQSRQHLSIRTPSRVYRRLGGRRDPLQICEVEYEQEDRLFVMRILPEPIAEDLCATSTISQKLVEGACRALETQKGLPTLPDCAKGFKSVFAKEDFDILLEHKQWDHAIELILGSEPKSSKVYPLSLVEQKKLDSFLEENLHTR